MFDPAKMSGEEWTFDLTDIIGPVDETGKYTVFVAGENERYYDGSSTATKETMQEIVMLHNERLIMGRRHWTVEWLFTEWIANDEDGQLLMRDDGSHFTGPHPIGLLAEADAYYRESGK